MRRRLSYSNVVASLALFVALGGVGYAAATLPDNSVGTRQLKERAVTLSRIADRARRKLAATGAQALLADHVRPETLGSVKRHKLRSVGPFTLNFNCIRYKRRVRLDLHAVGPPGSSGRGWVATAESDPESGAPVRIFDQQVAKGMDIVAAAGARPHAYQWTVGTLDLSSGHRLIHIDVYLRADGADADPAGLGSCTVSGAAWRSSG